MRHFKHTSPSIHLHAGKAWAGALEEARLAFYKEGKSPEDAQALGLKELIRLYGSFEVPKRYENKSLPRLMEAFAYYFHAFPLETDPVQPFMGRSGPMVEFSFALPLDPDLLHPETGEPIIYSGRADMIATYAGALSIYDDKTTSALGASWAEQWDRRSQFSGYTWAARAYGIPVTQVVVRGIAFLKTQINHAQALTTRTDHHIQEWHTQAVRDIKRAIACWKDGYWDVALNESCTAYGGCLFKQPCTSPNPEPWLTGGNYAVRIWNPVTREESDAPRESDSAQSL
jgi:hypothetical protein